MGKRPVPNQWRHRRRLRVASPRQGDSAKPDYEVQGERPAELAYSQRISATRVPMHRWKLRICTGPRAMTDARYTSCGPRQRNRWFADSALEGAGFEPSVPLANEGRAQTWNSSIEVTRRLLRA